LAELAASRPEGRLAMTAEAAARLRALEASPQRFLPGARQEMQQLRDLRDWIDDHNRQLEASQPATEAVASRPASPTEEPSSS
jgi:hypothetical protein